MVVCRRHRRDHRSHCSASPVDSRPDSIYSVVGGAPQRRVVGGQDSPAPPHWPRADGGSFGRRARGGPRGSPQPLLAPRTPPLFPPSSPPPPSSALLSS